MQSRHQNRSTIRRSSWIRTLVNIWRCTASKAPKRWTLTTLCVGYFHTLSRTECRAMEKIAEQYGYVVDANVAATVRDAQDLMDLIARTLDNAN